MSENMFSMRRFRLSGIDDVSTGGFCVTSFGADCAAVANNRIINNGKQCLAKRREKRVYAVVMPIRWSCESSEIVDKYSEKKLLPEI